MLQVNLIVGPWNQEALGINRVWTQIRDQLRARPDVRLSLLSLPYIHYRAEYPLAYGVFPLQLLLQRQPLSRGVNHFVRQHHAHVLNWLPIPRTIVTCHDLAEVQQLESGESTYRGFRRRHIRAYQRGMLAADRIVTVSEYVRCEIIRLYDYPPERVVTVHPAVDARVFYPQAPNIAVLRKHDIDPAGTYILYVGSEKPRKNLSLLLRAVQILLHDMPDVTVLKVGRAQRVESHRPLLDEVKRLGLNDHFRLIGDDLPDQALVHLYNVAKVFVFPSLLEGFGLPPLEAMACGLPVIVANTTSLPEVVGEAGLLVEPDAPDRLARLMRQILTDRALAQRLSDSGLQRAQTFTPEVAASRMLGVYETLYHPAVHDEANTCR